MGDAWASEFIERYGAADRERWRDLVVPFVPDPSDGRCLLTGGHGGETRSYRRRLPRDVQIFREWERHLARFGLDSRTINGNGDRQDVIIPKDSTPPLKNCREDVQLAEKYGVRWQSHHAIPLATHEREVPEWVYSDAKVEEFVRHRFPGAFRKVPSGAARRRAGQLCGCLYMAFRLLLPYDVIGDQLGIGRERAECTAYHGKKHGDLYFAGQKCCRSKPRDHT